MAEIEEKDGKKYIDGEEILLEIKYDLYGRIFALFFRMFGILIGFFFFLMFQNYIVKITSMIVILFFIVDFLGIFLFERLILTNDKVCLRYKYFIKSKFFSYKSVRVTKSNGTIFGGGSISFYNKEKKHLNIFEKIDMLCVSNETIKQLKKYLINKKILKGDEYEWIN
ncbi:MAG: hypothetical protein PHQ70_11535 [Arcobacter sp.]|jgi:hypothetical protein|uniref:hypothetical protein n=1 Tax=Arcobacter sp. TaxID=1872629 RepID=UPI00258BB461|nr:hypothetical protein [Arcobacter sp.]MDD3009479.1 hypothetical protein [Arcobacter sp.]MDY0051624.1 hypothetical protein [Aliarcobacter sp.]